MLNFRADICKTQVWITCHLELFEELFDAVSHCLVSHCLVSHCLVSHCLFGARCDTACWDIHILFFLYPICFFKMIQYLLHDLSAKVLQFRHITFININCYIVINDECCFYSLYGSPPFF